MIGVSRPASFDIDWRGTSGATIGSRTSRAKSNCITTTRGYAWGIAAIGFTNTSNCVIVTLVVFTDEIGKAAMLFGIAL